MLSPDSDYRLALKNEFATRARANSRYSLRAFSKLLGMPSAQLSDVLNAKYGISSEKATTIARKLGYSERETELFCTLVEKEHARSKTKREAAALRLEKFRSEASYELLQQDAFEAISGWYHFPIVELTRLEGFVNDPAWIARRLGISTIEADLAIERLKRLGLLKKGGDGKLAPSQDFYASPIGIPSEAKRNFHSQILRKASEALLSQPVEQRDFSASIFALPAAKVAEIREMITRFRREVDQKMEPLSGKDAVYCLSVQFFDISGGSHGSRN